MTQQLKITQTMIIFENNLTFCDEMRVAVSCQNLTKTINKIITTKNQNLTLNLSDLEMRISEKI